MKDSGLDPRREEALRKFGLISPLLEEDISPLERSQRKAFIFQEAEVSDRTLRRWILAYKTGGFDALVPKERKDKGSSKAIPPEAYRILTGAQVASLHMPYPPVR